MAIESGTGVVGGGSLAARPLGRALQLPPSFELTRGDEAAAGQEFGATFEIDEISRTFGVDAGDCSAGSAKKDWFEYSTSSNRGPGAGLDNALTSHGGLSEVSSTFATPNNLANDPNSDICTNYNWPTELELGSFNDYLLFDDMTLSQDLTPLGFPQFDNNLVLDMPSLISESEICGSLSLCNATDHGFGSMTAIGQGFKSLESTTDDLLPYECPSPSQPLTGLSRLPDSSQYPLYANTNLALSPQPSVAPRLEPPTANGNRNIQSPLPPVNFIDHNLPLRKSRDFVCSVDGCKMSYHRRAELHRHKKTHSGNKPHACRFVGCDRAGQNGFWRKDHLRQHLRQKHGVTN